MDFTRRGFLAGMASVAATAAFGKDDIDHGTILSCNNGESRTVRRVGILIFHSWVNRNDIFVTKQFGRQNIAGIGETNSIDKEIERDGVGAGDMDAPRLW